MKPYFVRKVKLHNPEVHWYAVWKRPTPEEKKDGFRNGIAVLTIHNTPGQSVRERMHMARTCASALNEREKARSEK